MRGFIVKVYRAKDGYYWHLRKKGKVLAVSPHGWETKEDCWKALQQLLTLIRDILYVFN